MLVCICNRVSDRDIRDAIHDGSSSYSDIQDSLSVGKCCGQCGPYAKALVNDTISQIQMANVDRLAYEVKI